MTRSRKILHLLALEPSLTVEQIAERLNTSLYLTQQGIYKMRSDGMLVPKPVTYTITAEGLDRLKRVRPPPKRKLTAKQLERNKLARKQKAAEQSSRESVQQAIRTQPSSVFQLGAM